MESECIRGEGVDFIFPDPDCNPFYSSAEEKYSGRYSTCITFSFSNELNLLPEVTDGDRCNWSEKCTNVTAELKLEWLVFKFQFIPLKMTEISYLRGVFLKLLIVRNVSKRHFSGILLFIRMHLIQVKWDFKRINWGFKSVLLFNVSWENEKDIRGWFLKNKYFIVPSHTQFSLYLSHNGKFYDYQCTHQTTSRGFHTGMKGNKAQNT